MINRSVALNEIRFETAAVSEDLLESIRKRGIAIPVRVIQTDDGYECVDGRKRLSAAAILAAEDSRFSRIPVMITNDFTRAGSAYWGNTKNKH